MIVPKFEDERLNRVRDFLLSNKEKFGEIYLVGGYIRDCLLEKESQDLDFSVNKNAALAAKSIADFFRGDFYMLDRQRETARAIIKINNIRMVIDVALIAGQTIFDDLVKRDFTVNAMAVNLNDLEKIIDPLGGSQDLTKKILHPCSISTFYDDPVRVLRAVRFIREFSLSVDDSDTKLIKEAANRITQVSGERIRDTLCQIFNINGVNTTLQLLIDLGIFKELFPELQPLQTVLAESPHVHNAFSHTLRTTYLTHDILESIHTGTWRNETVFHQDIKGLVKQFNEELSKYLKDLSVGSDLVQPLMVIASLYHDCSKTMIAPEIGNEKLIYPNHEEKSVSIAREKMKAYAFSNEEISLVTSVIQNHMDVGLKNFQNEEPVRNVHRFFKKTENFGILIVFFHLADLISTYEKSMSTARWNLAIKSSEKLLNGWFTQYNEVISPPSIIDGNDLMNIFGLPPGKKIGTLLNQIKEEQAARVIMDKPSAIKFIEEKLKMNN